MCLRYPFRRDLQLVLHTEDTAPQTFRMCIRLAEELDEGGGGDQLAHAAGGSGEVVPWEEVSERRGSVEVKGDVPDGLDLVLSWTPCARMKHTPTWLD